MSSFPWMLNNLDAVDPVTLSCNIMCYREVPWTMSELVDWSDGSTKRAVCTKAYVFWDGTVLYGATVMMVCCDNCNIFTFENGYFTWILCV